MDFTRFEELLRLWQDGEASPTELLEFETLLQSDPAFRKELVGSVLLEAGLHRKYGAAKALPAAKPAAKRRAWEAVAAAIVMAVSLLAVGRLLTRTDAPAHRVVTGEVASAGAAVSVLQEGQTFEVRGLAPATLTLKNGTRVILDAGSAGAIPAGAPGFVLSRGSGSFTLDTAPGGFTVTTPAGSLTASNAQFWILLRSSTRKLPKESLKRPELVVEGARGSVDVDAWETKAAVAAGQRRIFGAPLPAGGTDYARLLDRASLTLSAAIAKAAAADPTGVPMHAELEDEDGRIAFTVGLAHENKVRELTIDPKGGQVVSEETEDEDRSGASAAVKMSLAALIDKVLESVSGRAVEADLELKSGRLRAEIKILGPDGLREVKVDAETGEILTNHPK
jgi:uncharacterized membrane protein YkoI